MNTIKNYIQDNQERFLNELFELLSIPSISADSTCNEAMIQTANLVKKRLEEAGVDYAEICPTPGHPVVIGEKIIDPALPNVIVYGHYDVQPVDPLELWHTPPFEPTIKNHEYPEGAIYARGACDDKGQVYMHIKAFEAMMKTNTLPCNVKFMIEGEEEIGSDHLEEFIIKNKERFKGDVILISDTAMIDKYIPSIESGLRGLSYMEVEVTGPNRDLHSGVYGGAVANPANVLAKMIASLHDENNHITVEGFYDKVAILNEQQREELNKRPYNEKHYKEAIGVDELCGEKGYTTIERIGIRPTLDVNGIWSGYTGEGAKTVLPSKAHAKISMRLVPNQVSAEISDLFQKHFEKIAPKSVKVKVTAHHGGEPVVTSTDSISFMAASKAMEEAFGKKPVPTRGGGSIPIVALFEKELGLKTVLLGFGLDSDAIHSPNEKFSVELYYKGIETITLFYKNFTEMSK